MACSFIPSLLQNNKCTWSQRTPPENGKETSCRNQAQGAFVRARARVQPSAWHRAGRASYSPPCLSSPAAVLRPEHAGEPPGHAAGRAVHRHGSQSQAAHVVSVRRGLARPRAGPPSLGSCQVRIHTQSPARKEKLWLPVSRDPLKLNHIFHEVLTITLCILGPNWEYCCLNSF